MSHVNPSQFLSIEQLQDQYFSKKTTGSRQPSKSSFEEIWQQKTKELTGTDSLRFSKHAASRLADRDIRLSDSQMSRLSEGARKAGEKGIRESLVMVDQLAFIVNVKNQTVVTAMDQNETNENIFTNIDGAVII
ncbi:MAG: flagellar protein [Lachnospiraceae bacterium]|nr:flagellar protein [Lachnospiraceae bacterium]